MQLVWCQRYDIICKMWYEASAYHMLCNRNRNYIQVVNKIVSKLIQQQDLKLMTFSMTLAWFATDVARFKVSMKSI